MGATLHRIGGLPKVELGAPALRRVGLTAVAAIAVRAFHRGLDVRDQPMADYSTEPMYVSKRGARMAPRGGKRTRGGRSIFFPGGYREYKRAAGGSARVNLTLSGELLRSLSVLRVSGRRVVIGVRGAAAIYGAALQAPHKGRPARHWMGLSPSDLRAVRKALRRELRAALSRQGGSQ